jgi:hypothetical protein
MAYVCRTGVRRVPAHRLSPGAIYKIHLSTIVFSFWSPTKSPAKAGLDWHGTAVLLTPAESEQGSQAGHTQQRQSSRLGSGLSRYVWGVEITVAGGV